MKTAEEILNSHPYLKTWIENPDDSAIEVCNTEQALWAMQEYNKNIIDKTIRVLTAIIPLAEDATRNPTAGSHQEFIQEDKSDIRDAISLLNELKEQPVADSSDLPSDEATRLELDAAYLKGFETGRYALDVTDEAIEKAAEEHAGFIGFNGKVNINIAKQVSYMQGARDLRDNKIK